MSSSYAGKGYLNTGYLTKDAVILNLPLCKNI